jgi:hypothetical protein
MMDNNDYILPVQSPMDPVHAAKANNTAPQILEANC